MTRPDEDCHSEDGDYFLPEESPVKNNENVTLNLFQSLIIEQLRETSSE